MIVEIYDKDMSRLGVMDEISRLEWRRKYWECGEFLLRAPMNKHNAELIQEGNLIMQQGGDEAAEIRYIHIEEDEDGAEEIEARGKMLPRWIGKRVVLDKIATNDAPENIIARIVQENVISPSDERRRISQIQLAQARTAGQAIEYVSGERPNALDEIVRIARTAEVGFKVMTNRREKTNTFIAYAGRDLTAGNEAGNEPCIFSVEYDNIMNQTFESDSEDARNMAYVLGEEREDGTRTVVEVGEDASGLDRDEIFANAGGIEQTIREEDGSKTTIPDEEYAEMLRQRGLEDLAQYVRVLNFEARVNTAAGLEYRKDFDVGDKVTYREKRWGIQADVRITAVTEVYQPEGTEIDVVFGQPILTLGQKLRRRGR